MFDFSSSSRHRAVDLSYLERHNLTSSFTYSRRTIKTKFIRGERNTTSRVDAPLIENSQVIATVNASRAVLAASKPLVLEVPKSESMVDASVLSFGISTTIPRLNDSISQLQHWLPYSGATLHVLVPPHPNIPHIQIRMQELGMNVTIMSTTTSFPNSYFSQVRNLYQARSSKTQWISLIDDDTFFPSLGDLVAHLHNHDASTPKIIAPMSDDFAQIQKHGLMPFGGGGIFISLPLAAKLSSPAIFDVCLKSGKIEGDQILNECINKHTSIRPIFDIDLHQLDLHGDVSGFFESGRKSLSIHHWRSWFDVDMPAVALVSEVCGDACLLQRWLFEGDVVLSNGFSVIKYAGGVRFDLEEMEKTWDEDAERFLHSLGPLRERLSEDEKMALKMARVVRLPDGSIKQTYIRYAQPGGMDEVLELVWVR